MSALIVTLTANPLAETTYVLPGVAALGMTQRAASESFQVGGKGFNVAKMLARLDVDTLALSFGGNGGGDVCSRWLKTHARFNWELIPSKRSVRTGAVVRDPAGTETTFLGADCVWEDAAYDAMSLRLRSLPSDAIVALCGSFPGWNGEAASHLCGTLREFASDRRLIVDSYGPPLRDLTQLPLELVKINRDELRALNEGEVERDAPVPEQLNTLLDRLPVKRWIVTDGPRPVHFASHQQTFQVIPPTITEVSPTGSGDVFLAACLAEDWTDETDWPARLGRAVFLSSRNAAHPGVAEFKVGD